MQETIEDVVLNQLIHNEAFCRKVLPHLKSEYFETAYRSTFELIVEFIVKYNKLPNVKVLAIELQTSKFAGQEDVNDIYQLIAQQETPLNAESFEWLMESTEKWCKDRAVWLAVMESIQIIDGKTEKGEGSIPEILTNALSITFDTNIGHDYLENADERFDFYNTVEEKMPFDLDILNEITGGGTPNKTLNLVMAGCVHPDTKIKIRRRRKKKLHA